MYHFSVYLIEVFGTQETLYKEEAFWGGIPNPYWGEASKQIHFQRNEYCLGRILPR